MAIHGTARRSPDALALLGLALLWGAGHVWFRAAALIDSDRHYHLAVSRLVSWAGRVATLPQVADLGWGRKFPDKEWLFHLFTGWGYRAAGEGGVVAVCGLLALVAVAGLYAWCRAGAGPLTAFLLCAIAALGNETFLYRLQMVRPHVLAIAAFVWLGAGLAARRPRLAAVAGAAFALGYHAIYVPLGLLAWFAWVQRHEATAREAALYGVGGVAAGVLLNPVFPGNLQMLAAHASIAFGAAGAKASGIELLPLTSSELLIHFASPLLVLVLALGRPWWAPFTDASARRDAATWAGVALGFWGLTCVTPRAAEYAVPLTAVAGAFALGRVFEARAGFAWTGWAWVAVGLGLCLPAFRGARDLTPTDRYAQAVAVAVAQLPPEAAGKKVLNCAFDEGSVLLDLRPDVRVVDVLSPELLEQSAPQLSALRVKLQQGELADPALVVRQSFQADYVLCGYPKAEAMLEADPRFVRLSPAPGEDPPGPRHELFAVLDAPAPTVGKLTVENPLKPGVTAGTLSPVPGSAYVELPPRGPPRDAQGCVTLNVPAEEAQKGAGAVFALIGGGPLLSLTFDGAPLFESAAPVSPLRWNEFLVPLPIPLTQANRLALRVCPSKDRAASGAALSLWTWAEMLERCKQVGRPLASGGVPSGAESATCLAPMAVAPVHP